MSISRADLWILLAGLANVLRLLQVVNSDGTVPWSRR